MSDPSASVTDLNRVRARKRHPPGSLLGGRFAPAARAESGTDLPSAGAPDPWGDPNFTPAAPAPKVTLVLAADGAGGPASSAPPVGTRRGPARLAAKQHRDQLSATMQSFADDYAAGFGSSMEAAMDMVDRLSRDFAAVAPCLPPDRHRRLAGRAAGRIVHHVDVHGSGDVSSVARQCLDEAERANQAAYDAGLRAPTHTGL